MRTVTIAMLCAHAARSRSAVVRGLRAAGIRPRRVPGVKGMRLTEEEANHFLHRQWPAVGPLRFPTSGKGRSR